MRPCRHRGVPCDPRPRTSQPLLAQVYNAFLRTIEDGQHTADIYNPSTSRKQLGCKEFALAVIDRLGSQPVNLAPHPFTGAAQGGLEDPPHRERAAELSRKSARTPWVAPVQKKLLHGMDIFVDWRGGDAAALAKAASEAVRAAGGAAVELSLITNRGVKVWPGGFPGGCADSMPFTGSGGLGVVRWGGHVPLPAASGGIGRCRGREKTHLPSVGAPRAPNVEQCALHSSTPAGTTPA